MTTTKITLSNMCSPTLECYNDVLIICINNLAIQQKYRDRYTHLAQAENISLLQIAEQDKYTAKLTKKKTEIGVKTESLSTKYEAPRHFDIWCGIGVKHSDNTPITIKVTKHIFWDTEMLTDIILDIQSTTNTLVQFPHYHSFVTDPYSMIAIEITGIPENTSRQIWHSGITLSPTLVSKISKQHKPANLSRTTDGGYTLD